MGPSRKKQTFLYANNKGADQPAHPRILISVFIIRLLENIIYTLAAGKDFNILDTIRSLRLTQLETSKTGFLASRPININLFTRGVSRISGKGVHMYKGVGVRFAEFI